MNRWLERVLNVHPGDLGRGVPLSACLFLTISAYVIGKVARDALFLTQFPAVQLPYADIASGILVGFVVALYLQLGRRISLGSLLIASPLFLPSLDIVVGVHALFTRGMALSSFLRLGGNVWSSGAHTSLDASKLSTDGSRGKAHFRHGRGEERYAGWIFADTYRRS